MPRHPSGVATPRRMLPTSPASRSRPVERAASAAASVTRARSRKSSPASVRSDPARMALEQTDAELTLEPADLRRQAGLGDPEPLGRAGEAALVRDRDEISKVTELHVGPDQADKATTSARRLGGVPRRRRSRARRNAAVARLPSVRLRERDGLERGPRSSASGTNRTPGVA